MRFPESFFYFLLVNNMISIYNDRRSKKHDKNEMKKQVVNKIIFKRNNIMSL